MKVINYVNYLLKLRRRGNTDHGIPHSSYDAPWRLSGDVRNDRRSFPANCTSFLSPIAFTNLLLANSALSYDMLLLLLLLLCCGVLFSYYYYYYQHHDTVLTQTTNCFQTNGQHHRPRPMMLCQVPTKEMQRQRKYGVIVFVIVCSCCY